MKRETPQDPWLQFIKQASWVLAIGFLVIGLMILGAVLITPPPPVINVMVYLTMVGSLAASAAIFYDIWKERNS